MVQDDELVWDGHAGCQKLANGPNNPLLVKISLGIIVSANYQDAGMVSSNDAHQVV
jgi:hypothetical protein